MSRLLPRELQIVVPDELLEDLAGLRVDYARFLHEYKNVLESSPEAQKEFVDTLPELLVRSLGPDHSFQSYFNIFVDENLSLFDITYVEAFCYRFPADVRQVKNATVEHLFCRSVIYPMFYIMGLQ